MNAHGHALTCFLFSLKRKDLGRLHRNLLPGRAQPRAQCFSESGSWTTGQNHLERLLEVQVRGAHPAPTVSVCCEHVHLFDSEVPTASSVSHHTHTHTHAGHGLLSRCVFRSFNCMFNQLSFQFTALRGAWGAQSVQHPTSAQVMISRFVSSSPRIGL